MLLLLRASILPPVERSCNFCLRYRRLLSRFHADIKHPDVEIDPKTLTHKIPIIGFSATFGRHDKLALGSIFERIVYHRSFLEMIKEEWQAYIPFCIIFGIDGISAGCVMYALQLSGPKSILAVSQSIREQGTSIQPV